MKKFLKALVAVLAVVVLAGCSKISEGYAEDIRVAEAKGEHMTYAEVVEDLGLPHVDLVFPVVGGVATWYKGYESLDEATAAHDAGKTVSYITITFNGNKLATDAKYGEWTPEEEEAE